jgi:3-hydroxy-9,10-secoandrosta-1,3,5(10)-triene-9,17-dione monooxygenase reductase component
MRGLATGVTVVAAECDGTPVGTTVNSFASASLEPPMVLFCIGRGSRTWPAIEEAGCFAVSFLCADQEETARRFAGPHAGRFAGQRTSVAVTGAPILSEAACFVDCTLEGTTEAGDHLVVLGVVEAAGCLREAEPLVFAGGGYRGA